MSSIEQLPESKRYFKHGLWIYSLIFLLSLIAFTEFHELMHLILGRLMGIPAVFLSATSVGVPNSYDTSIHSWFSLFMMNVPAFIISFVTGIIFLVIYIRKRGFIKTTAGRFFAWFTIIGVPYISIQMMTSAEKGIASGSGPDFAYMVYALGLSGSRPIVFLLILTALLLTPVTFYAASFIFEKSNTYKWSLTKIKIWRKVIAGLIALVPVSFFMNYIYTYIKDGEILHDNMQVIFFWWNAIPLMMLFLIDWKDQQTQEYMKKFFYPSLLVGFVLIFLPEKIFLDFIFTIFIVPMIVIAMVFFSQIRRRRFTN